MKYSEDDLKSQSQELLFSAWQWPFLFGTLGIALAGDTNTERLLVRARVQLLCLESGLPPETLTHDFTRHSLRGMWGLTPEGPRQDLAQPTQRTLVRGRIWTLMNRPCVNQHSSAAIMRPWESIPGQVCSHVPRDMPGWGRRQIPLLLCFSFQSGPPTGSLSSPLSQAPFFFGTFEGRLKQAMTY